VPARLVEAKFDASVGIRSDGNNCLLFELTLSRIPEQQQS